jgi:hypothetical protein
MTLVEAPLSMIVQLRKEFVNHHFTNYLKNQKVIIVGPDTQLIGKGMGQFIDSFDIVVRHNTVFEYLPFDDKLRHDFGSKCNILYFAPQCIKDYSNKKETVEKLKLLKNKHGLNYIVYQNGNKDGKYITGPHCFQKELDWFKKTCTSIGITMHFCDKLTRNLIVEMVKNNSGGSIIPRTGFISIYDILVHSTSDQTLNIIGMSFYNGGGHAFRPKAIKVLDPKLNAFGKDSGSHNSNVEITMFNNLLETGIVRWECNN